MHMWWDDGLGGWDWIWMGAMIAIVWVPLVLLTIWGLRQLGQGSQSPPTDRGRDGEQSAAPTEPRDLARRAYAQGEISREQFLRIIEDLDRTEAGTARPSGAAHT